MDTNKYNAAKLDGSVPARVGPSGGATGHVQCTVGPGDAGGCL